MKKKIMLMVILIFSILLTGTIGVNAMTGGKIFEKVFGLGAGYVKKGSMDDVLSINNNKSLTLDMITQEYELKPLLLRRGISRGLPQLDNNWADTRLYTFNQVNPIEYIRKIDGNNVLVVYKTKDPVGNIVYLYCFFENISAGTKNDAECWVLKSRILFASKKLSYSDFKEIKAGSDVHDVYSIDPAVSKYCNIDSSFPYIVYSKEEIDEYVTNRGEIIIQDTVRAPRSYHLLTDGLLSITYDYNDDGSYIVSDINYSKDYMMYDELSKKEVLRKIVESDLPN